ncbi:CPBP family intramembrane metalloprotease [Pseudomonas gingeri]|uniref:CPBP family intramembrane metalloprotease n=2 Tax=Pseudomonas gingeri TaxID=117681 RepID=A0A7Y7YD84_9PSED|nr:CPBP family intramembrane metalloprotease [Pseudomonas gingeri]NWC34152.1 CPBP family intramembrane metalloprotease [Pseudomonas gingeri]
MAFTVPILYGIPAFFLIAVVLLQRRLWPGFELVGRFDTKLLGLGVSAVVLAYLIEVAVVLHLGLGREFQMSMLGFGLTTAQYWLMIGSVLVLPPIVEELAFRTFLLQALPFNKHWAVATVAIFLSAGCFMWAHIGIYQLWTTHALMFTLGMIFAVGRVMTRGVVYSMILHSVAVACALVLNYAGEVLGWSGW